jgi:hypothetical protein
MVGYRLDRFVLGGIPWPAGSLLFLPFLAQLLGGVFEATALALRPQPSSASAKHFAVCRVITEGSCAFEIGAASLFLLAQTKCTK